MQVRNSEDGDQVWVETPSGGTEWRLVELRPVSEGPHFFSSTSVRDTHKPPDFADPPPIQSARETAPEIFEPCEQDPLVPLEDPPTTLVQWAVLILNTANPTLKVSSSATSKTLSL